MDIRFNMVLKKLENAFNRYLALDSESPMLLAPLMGRVMGLHLKRPNLTLFFLFKENSIELTTERPTHVDTEIFTTLFQLMRLKWNKTSSLVNSQFHIQGDVETAQLFNQLFEKHHIDWEEKLSHLIGDVAAHKMTGLLKKSTRFMKKNSEKLTQDCSEYLQEEANYLPPSHEVAAFRHDVDALRLQLDRLQARVDGLKTKRAP